MIRRLTTLFIAAACATTLSAAEPAYQVDTIEGPEGTSMEVGGITMMPSGKVAMCLHNGDVWFYDPAAKQWTQFAAGLHDPLGLVAISESELVVMQLPELTRLRDMDGDNVADEYNTITDGWGMSGNYHEFTYGPAVDADGNFMVSLNCASSGAGVRHEVRGEFREKAHHGRMYACVPWRGWVLKVSPTGQITPWAYGFRSPNGIGYDAHGRLLVTDNQGDWLGTSKLFHVERDKFYGHPAALTWTEGFEGRPLDIPAEKLNAMRQTAAVLFPHGFMANSPTQPIAIPEGFGPFAGQTVIGEMNSPRLVRVMLEEVDGKTQGACVALLEKHGLNKGNHRMVFSEAGELWIGQTSRGYWVGDNAVQRVKFTGTTPMDVQRMSLTRDGFELTFTRPVDPKTVKSERFKFERYRYAYHSKYGSPQMDQQAVKVESVKLSDDKKTVTVELEKLVPGFVYQLKVDGVKSADGRAVDNPLICYTLNRLRKG